MTRDRNVTYDHEEALAQKEVDKVEAKYQAQAAANQKNKGFWGGLGDRILGGIDFITSKFSL